MGKRIGMISLGCAKNQVNAEQMMYLLQQAGYELLSGVEGADVVIINTCGFIDSAKSEAIDNILAMGALKEEGIIGKILVTGCLSQRYQEEILREILLCYCGSLSVCRTPLTMREEICELLNRYGAVLVD